MGKTTYKEQTIETETKMVIALRRLLRAHGNYSNKSFFCMYLIRPSVSPALAGFPPRIVQYERWFEAFARLYAYRMATKKYCNLEKILSLQRVATQTLSQNLHLMFDTVAGYIKSYI